MKIFFLIALRAIAFAVGHDIKLEDGILVLTKDNFQEAIEDNKYILVEFYAPWCGACKSFAPEYVKASKELAGKKPEMKLAKVDATEEKELAEKYKIVSYPTLWFFKNGKQIPCKSVETANEVISLLKKKMGYPATILKTAQQADSFKQSANVVVVGFFKDNKSSDATAFLEVAEQIDDFPFAITSEDSVYKELKKKNDGVVLFKKFDEGRSDFLDLKSFIMKESLPLVMEFSRESQGDIFGGDIKLIAMLFISESDGSFRKLVEMFTNAAMFYKNKVRFTYIDIDEEENKQLEDFFGLQKSDVPTIRMINMGKKIIKYKMDSKITEKSIRKFVQDVVNGQVKPFLLSQKLPLDWNKHPVKILVKSNFEKIAFDPDDDVLVEFYAPWCGHCKQLEPIYEKLAIKYEHDKNIVIAKIDGTANEFENVKIKGFPTIKLYKSGSNEVINYKGENTLEGLSKFLDSDGKVGGEPAKDADDDDDDDDDDNDDEDDDDDKVENDKHNKDEL